MENIFLIPDKGTYKETYKFYTKKYKSINGFTYCEPLLDKPKVFLQYEVTINDTQMQRYFSNTWRGTIHNFGTFAVPRFSFAEPVTQSYYGDKIYVDNSQNVFTVNQGAYAFVGVDQFEYVTVTAIYATYIKINRNISTSVGQLVCPDFIGVVSGAIKNSYLNTNSIKVGIDVEEIRGY